MVVEMQAKTPTKRSTDGGGVSPKAIRRLLAEVATLLGDSKRVAANHYVYALTDYREVDRRIALARLRV